MLDEEDRYIEETITDTLQGVAGLLSPVALEEMRAFLRDSFTTHPVMSQLIEEQRPREPKVATEESVKEGLEAAEREAARLKQNG